jgi:hypothetical protein
MMNRNTAACAAFAAVAGWMMLSGCAGAPAPAQESAAALAMMDISQVPGLESTLYVSGSASATRPPEPAPRVEERATAAMQAQTEGMAPGAVAGGPKDQVTIRIPEPSDLEAGGAKPVLLIPALSSSALSGPPEEGPSWKKPLPPLQSLEGK